MQETEEGYQVEYKSGLYHISHKKGSHLGSLDVSLRELENILEAAKEEY